MSTSIPSSSETLLAPLQTRTSGPVELNSPVRGVPRTADKADVAGHDTVALSVPAQIRQLVELGQSANEIANTLGLTTSLVNSYLYVPLDTVDVSTPAPSPAAGVL